MDENQGVSQIAVADRKTKIVRDVFFNLATMSALYTALTSLVFLMFAILDSALPNEFTCGSCSNEMYGIAYYVSIVIVSYALYAYFSWKMRHNEGIQAMHQSSVFHQIVIYITLFLMGVVLAWEAVDLITNTVYYGITAVSFAKFLAMVLIAGSVFGYHFIDLRRSGDTTHSKMALTLWWVLAAVVAGTIMGSFLVLGSPASQKERRFDETRSYDLRSIETDIGNYAYDMNSLPGSLSDLSSQYYDSQTGLPYEYKPTGATTYMLCANFSRNSDEDYRNQFRQVYGHDMQTNVRQTNDDFYTHGRGHTCYNLTGPSLVHLPSNVSPNNLDKSTATSTVSKSIK